MDETRSQILFLRKFAHLYDAGVSLAEALELARAEVGGTLHEAVGEVVDDIYRGTALADALAARPHCFSSEVIAVIRTGEHRGELSAAARNAADGLEGGVFESVEADPEAAEALLLLAGDAPVLHVYGNGIIRRRTPDGLEEIEESWPQGAVAAIRQRAGPRGAFLWEDRLIRVASADGHVVIRLSGTPEPVSKRVWKHLRSDRCLVGYQGERHADFDACLRGVLREFEGVRVAIDLPVPEALSVRRVQDAISLDPDLVVVRTVTPDDEKAMDMLADGGVRVVFATTGLEPYPHATFVTIP
ncbi:MAG: type II secretion system F family protein [Planctomycetota bacterium]